jgi:hypothetical protein
MIRRNHLINEMIHHTHLISWNDTSHSLDQLKWYITITWSDEMIYWSVEMICHNHLSSWNDISQWLDQLKWYVTSLNQWYITITTSNWNAASHSLDQLKWYITVTWSIEMVCRNLLISWNDTSQSLDQIEMIRHTHLISWNYMSQWLDQLKWYVIISWFVEMIHHNHLIKLKWYVTITWSVEMIGHITWSVDIMSQSLNQLKWRVTT